MWAAKIKFSEEGTLIGSRCVKHGVSVFGFPLSYYYEKNLVIAQITGTIIGNQKAIKDFVSELKKEKRVVNLELNDNFFIGTIKEPIYAKILYNKDIIHLSPALISEEGYEIINIASFNKKFLINAIDIIEKKLGGELLSIENKKIKSISIVKMHPDLTDKQKTALEIAIKNGYYEVPRKTSVKKLAKLAGLSFSTFQVHLRKAEQKLMPYFFEA